MLVEYPNPRRPTRPPRYRIYIVTHDGHISGPPHVIECEDNRAAIGKSPPVHERKVRRALERCTLYRALPERRRLGPPQFECGGESPNSQDRTAELISLEARSASAVPYPVVLRRVTWKFQTKQIRLRQQAQRALRLARGITDDRAAQALKAYATSLFERVTSLEHPMVPLRPSITEQQPVQQQQAQPRDGDKET